MGEIFRLIGRGRGDAGGVVGEAVDPCGPSECPWGSLISHRLVTIFKSPLGDTSSHRVVIISVRGFVSRFEGRYHRGVPRSEEP
jgi:hypothetical protein